MSGTISNSETKIETREDILKRLRRIEGQVKGIHRMVEENKSCSDILVQVAAVRSAMNKVGSIILKNHSMKCIEDIVSAEDKEVAMTELTKTMQSFISFTE